MSAAGLFPFTKATLRLTGITAMNTAMTNFLLAMMVFKSSNPGPPTKVFRDVSDKVFSAVLDAMVAETKRGKKKLLSKEEMVELEELARTYKKIMEVVE